MVPGEFPEWFDGENWQSLGMAMSPWMPPTYLWLGVEGLAGVEPTPGKLAVSPNLPAHWTWLIMRNLPYCGQQFSFFIHGGRLHTTRTVESTLQQVLYSRDVTHEVEVEGDLLAVALEDDNGAAILVAAQETSGAEGRLTYRGRSQDISLAAGAAALTRWEN